MKQLDPMTLRRIALMLAGHLDFCIEGGPHAILSEEYKRECRALVLLARSLLEPEP